MGGKFIWSGTYYAVVHEPGGKYWNGQGSQGYGRSEHFVADLRRGFGSGTYGRPHRALNPPAAVEGRATKEQVAALVAWARNADEVEPARLKALADAKAAEEKALEEIRAGQLKQLEQFGAVDADERYAHFTLGNGVRVQALLTPTGIIIESWKHPAQKDALSYIKLLSTLPTGI